MNVYVLRPPFAGVAPFGAANLRKFFDNWRARQKKYDSCYAGLSIFIQIRRYNIINV